MNFTLRLWDGYPHTSTHLQDDVMRLQKLLNEHGFEVSVDGYFGFGTEEAVRKFQVENQLTQDGIVGRQTWFALGATPSTSESTVSFETTFSPRNSAMLLDEKEAKKYHEFIFAAAAMAKVPVSIICGIGSRESQWGRALHPRGPGGTGDKIRRSTRREWRPDTALPPDGGGFGRGLMQIDYDAHQFARGVEWQDAQKNILYGGRVLKENLTYFMRRQVSNPLQAAIAAYNCGPGNVRQALRRGRSVDYYTAHRDYSANVLDRAGWFEMVGWK